MAFWFPVNLAKLTGSLSARFGADFGKLDNLEGAGIALGYGSLEV
jgi:hypothetical protein